MDSNIVEQIEALFETVDDLYHQNKNSEVIQELSKIEVLMKAYPYPYFHEYTANIFNEIAKFYQLVDQKEQAIYFYNRTLEIVNTILDKESEKSAYLLTEIGNLYQEMGKLDDALPFLQKALKIRKNILDINHPDTEDSLNNLGFLYSSMGMYDEALPLYKQVLKVRKNILGINHPDTAISLNNLGFLYSSMGMYNKALPLYKKALKVRKNILGIDHPDTASSLKKLGLLYSSMVMYDEALPLLQQALDICKNILGINHIYTASSLNNLGFLYSSMGMYNKALPLYKQALKICKNLLGINHPDTATSLNNLGLLYSSMGMYNEALHLLQQALKICKNILGINHHDTARSLNSLGFLYSSMGMYNKALPLYKQALKVRKNILGIDHPDTVSSLNNLGLLYESMGMYNKALPLLEEALEICKTILDIHHPDTASSLNNLGFLYESMGMYNKALPLLEEALEIRENVLGINHPDTETSLSNLGLLYEAMGRHEQAFDLTLKSCHIQLKFISQIFKVSSEQQRLIYFQQNYYKFELFISLVFQSLSNSPTAIQSAFGLIQKRKIIVTEITILQKNALLSGVYPHLEPLFKEYQSKTQEIINLTFKTFTEAQQNYRQRLIQAQQEIESEFIHQIPELNLEQQLLEIDHRAVALELPEGSTLLEFVRFEVYDSQAIAANHDSPWKPARYLAFILSAGQPDNIQMIDLGEAENIDRLIKVFGENINPKKEPDTKQEAENINPKESNRGLRVSGDFEEINTDNLDKLLAENLQQLQQLLFNPIKPHLPADTKKLIIAADGQLNLLPFEVIPINENQYLMDEYTISYLNVGRDIIRLKFPSTTQPTAPLIIANPDYNLSDETAITSQDTPTQTQVNIGIPDSDLRKSQPGGKFAPIPGTALEALQVSQYLGVTPQTEKKALESLVKSQLSPRILHIATHGYFLPVDKLQEKFEQSNIKLERLNLTISTLDPFHQAGMQNIQNPLLRAGLAFAGANTALNGGKLPPAAEDGILTAQDVATSLDLRGTELVVLSACESGLGDINLGESVQGLRHAFIQAGAKSLIVSLWAVSDIATAILMGRFYHYYLEDKLPVGKALEQAKRYVCNLTVRQMRDTWLTKEKIEYVGRYSPKEEDNLRILANDDNDYQPYKHPKYWAVFICLGLAD